MTLKRDLLKSVITNDKLWVYDFDPIAKKKSDIIILRNYRHKAGQEKNVYDIWHLSRM